LLGGGDPLRGVDRRWVTREVAGVLRVFGIIAPSLGGALWHLHVLGSSYCVGPEGGLFDGIADVEADKVLRFGLFPGLVGELVKIFAKKLLDGEPCGPGFSSCARWRTRPSKSSSRPRWE